MLLEHPRCYGARMSRRAWNALTLIAVVLGVAAAILGTISQTWTVIHDGVSEGSPV